MLSYNDKISTIGIKAHYPIILSYYPHPRGIIPFPILVKNNNQQAPFWEIAGLTQRGTEPIAFHTRSGHLNHNLVQSLSHGKGEVPLKIEHLT